MRKGYMPWLFLLPALAILLALTIYPTVYCWRLSFYSLNFAKPWKTAFVGLANFVEAFQDPLFLISLNNTLFLVLMSTLGSVLLGYTIALLLDKGNVGWMVTPFVLPMVIPAVVTGLIWLLLYSPAYGISDYFFHKVGIDNPPQWIGDKRMALFSIAIVDMWRNTPFVILLMFAGLRAIPRSYYEVAQMEGSSYLQTLRHIIIPALKPLLMIAVLFRITDSYKIFDLIYVLTRGGPGDATETLTYHTYLQGFFFLEAGKAATSSIIILLIATVLATSVIRTTRWKI